MAFSNVLKDLRKNKELTQSELANLTGLTVSAISMYETGQREPSFEILELLADFFNVDMNKLLDVKPKDAPAATPTKTLALTPDEHHLVTDYRRLTPDGKEYVKDQVIFRLNKEAEEREEAEKKETHTA